MPRSRFVYDYDEGKGLQAEDGEVRLVAEASWRGHRRTTYIQIGEPWPNIQNDIYLTRKQTVALRDLLNNILAAKRAND